MEVFMNSVDHPTPQSVNPVGTPKRSFCGRPAFIHKRRLLLWALLALVATLAAVLCERSANLPALVYLEIFLLAFVSFLFALYSAYAAVQISKIRTQPEFKITLMVEAVTVVLFLASVWLVIYFVMRMHSDPAPP